MSSTAAASHAMDLRALQVTLRQFAAERDWQPFHTPKNLAMALLVEAAELAEVFQWLTPEQSVALRGDMVARDRIGDEVADVLLYLLQLADHCDVDLKRAVGRKLVKNARKHPPLRPGAPAGAAAAIEARTHVLLDYENVQPSEDELRALVPGVDELWLFHGPHQKGMAERFASFGDRLMLVPIDKRGKNSLDFHLSFYLGYVAARHPDAQLVVVANDRGYEPMIGHAKELGFSAVQLGFARTSRKSARGERAAAGATRRRTGAGTKAARASAAKEQTVPAAAKPGATARKRAAKKAAPAQGTGGTKSGEAAATPPAPAAPKKTRTRKTSETPAAPPSTPVAPAPPADAGARLADTLRRMGVRRPRKLGPLKRALASLQGVAADAVEVQSTVDQLLAAGVITVGDGGAVSYHL